MKILVFGSANVDHTYQMPHLVRAGETLSSRIYARNAGGKGLNQAVALGKAGNRVYFAGAIGSDGGFLHEELEHAGVNTRFLRQVDAPTGHALIQVDENGQNAIILFSGANGQIAPEQVDETLQHFDAGDWVLLQNEISCGEYILRKAHEKGMHVALNPSPISAELLSWPLDRTDLFLLNEVEGEDITGETEPERMLEEMLKKYPDARVVLTLGEKGALYGAKNERLYQAAFPVKPVDTTAAGDTFTGYFLQSVVQGKPLQEALRTAACAAAIAVSREGAGKSIPLVDEVEKELQQG